MSIFDLYRPRGRHHRRQWRHRARHRAGARRCRAATSRSGAAMPTRTRTPPPTMADGAGKADTAVCDVTDPASVKSAMARDAGQDSAASTAASPMPALAAADATPSSTAPRNNGAACSPPISTACFHVFQAAARHADRARHRRAIAFGRLVATSSLASLFGTARNRALCRDQGRHQRAGPRARGRTGASGRHRQCHPARLDQERHDRRRIMANENSSPT